MKKRSRKCLSALLALALFTTTVPVAPVMAAQESSHTETLPAEDGTTGEQPSVEVGETNEPTQPAGDGKYWDKEGGDWVAKDIPPDATEIAAYNLPTQWSAGYYIVRAEGEEGLTIDSRVTVTGDVHLILADGASLTVYGGIQVQDTNKLTIYAQSTEASTMGKLTATSVSNNEAGIGGGDGGNGGSITIEGGTVNATGGYDGAGIGGGRNGTGGSITIAGGTVNAIGDGYGAGIGGGSDGAGGSITIEGGNVEANGHVGGAGIGGGYSGNGGTIIINDGTVKANGGISGAGIGGGRNGTGGSITINGGTVTATGGDGVDDSVDGGAGIGGGYGDDGGTIAINGGSVKANGGVSGAGIGGGNGGNGGSITIKGGTVNATGSGNGAGIGGGDAGDGGTFSTGENGQAVIVASSISDKSQQGTWNGIIIEGKSGQLYGSSVTPIEDFTIPVDTILTIPKDTTLTINEGITMTNNGTVINKGTISGKIDGNQPLVPVAGVSLDKTTLTFTEGDIATLTATVTPENATNKAVTWSSDNESVATVDAGGKVTAVSKGTATITVTTEDGSFTAVCKVTVTPATVAVAGVTLDKTTLTLTEGESRQLTATVAPENALNKAVTWSSDNESVATVDANGKVTAISEGKGTITVTTVDGGKAATCTITVEADEPPFSGHYTYPVNVAETEHGSILLAKENRYAADGEEVSFTVVPDEGFTTDTVTVTTKTGKDVAVTDEGEGIYTFTMPTSKVTLSATFVETEEPEPAPELPFTDVSENDWFYDPVRWAFLEGLMTGTSDTEFSPNLATTRGMIVSVLYRLEGNPDLSDDILGYPYEDVDANAWYAMPVYWARLHGIVSGYNNNQFGPNDAITREQLAAILMNYADYKGMDVSARADLSAYSDADTISAWANATMQWAVAEGYISGMTADTLAPQGSATRAQVASIFQRFLDE